MLVSHFPFCSSTAREKKRPAARAPLPKTFLVPSGHLSVITRPPKQYSFPSLGLPNFPLVSVLFLIRALLFTRATFSLLFLPTYTPPPRTATVKEAKSEEERKGTRPRDKSRTKRQWPPLTSKTPATAAMPVTTTTPPPKRTMPLPSGI